MCKGQKMLIIPCTVLVAIALFTGVSFISLNKEAIVLAQYNSDNDVGKDGAIPQEQNAAMNTIEAMIAEGAVALEDKAFSPNPINITLGQNITWTNADSLFHTVTSGTDPDDPQVAKEFDSKALSPGEKFSHVFNNESLPGTELPYFCQIHPTMTGKIIVSQ
jgi:plastocyanin